MIQQEKVKLEELKASMLLVQNSNRIITEPIERLRSKSERSIKIRCRLLIFLFSFYKGKFFAYPFKQETKINSKWDTTKSRLSLRDHQFLSSLLAVFQMHNYWIYRRGHEVIAFTQRCSLWDLRFHCPFAVKENPPAITIIHLKVQPIIEAFTTNEFLFNSSFF